MRRGLLVLIAAMILAAAVACGLNEPEAAQKPIPEATAAPGATAADTPALAATPVPESAPPQPSPSPSVYISHTTGLPVSGEYKPVLVDIENDPAARPQTGLQTADVVYEVPVEGDITRFVCVFSDNVPETAMPVRSGRVSFLYIQHEWDAIFMHWGGSGHGTNADYTFYGNKLYDKVKIDADGLYGGSKYSKYFKRKHGVASVHNVMAYPKKAQSLYNYTPKPLHWQFDNDVSYSGKSVSKINLRMCSNKKNFVTYTYDPENDVYLRSMGGKAFVSAETGKQVSLKNIIVQYSTYKVKGSAHYKVWAMVGKGKADIYVGGILVKGSWEKKSEDSETVYYDDKGKQIILRPGNTWIEICPEK
jgi:hypothetical protein